MKLSKNKVNLIFDLVLILPEFPKLLSSMSKIYFVFTLLFLTTAVAQKVYFKGTVIFEKVPLENVNALNISTSDFTVSNEMGEFTLIVGLGDTLQLNYLGMNPINKVIDRSALEKAKMTFFMTNFSSSLDEVRINTIDAFSLGIIPKRVKPLTVNERRFKSESEINSANLTGFFGLGIGLDPILNAINGRTKELKNNLAIERKQAILKHLKLNYSEYLIAKLENTDDEKLLQFYYYLIDLNEIEKEVYSLNTEQVNFYLFNKYVEFQQLLNE